MTPAATAWFVVGFYLGVAVGILIIARKVERWTK